MSDLVDFRRLKNLIAVARAGNITLAAKRLYVSQPTLSKEIKDLEEELQVPLLVRHGKGVQATHEAEILIAGGLQLIKLHEELLASARAHHQVAFKPMRLGFSSFVDHALFEMVCSIHKALYPLCEIRAQQGDNVELLAMLQLGQIDAALLTLPVSGIGLRLYPFIASRLVVCMKVDDPLAKQNEVAPADIKARVTIFRNPKQHPEAHQVLVEMLTKVGIDCTVDRANNTPIDIQWMVESGHGYALVREGAELLPGLVTRPVADVTWTVDSALVLGRLSSLKTIPLLVRELNKRVRLQAFLPPPKPVRSERPPPKRTMELFGSPFIHR